MSEDCRLAVTTAEGPDAITDECKRELNMAMQRVRGMQQAPPQRDGGAAPRSQPPAGDGEYF